MLNVKMVNNSWAPFSCTTIRLNITMSSSILFMPSVGMQIIQSNTSDFGDHVFTVMVTYQCDFFDCLNVYAHKNLNTINRWIRFTHTLYKVRAN